MTRAWLVRQPALNPHLDKENKKNTPNVISQHSWGECPRIFKMHFCMVFKSSFATQSFFFPPTKAKKQKFIEFFQNWRRNNRRINNSNNNNWNWNPYVLDSVVVFQLRVEGVVITHPVILSLSQTVSQSVWQASRVIQGDQHHWWNCTHTLSLQLLNGWNANHSLDRIYSFIRPFRESCQ